MQTSAYFLAPLQHFLAKHVRQTSTGSVFISLRTKPASQKQPNTPVGTILASSDSFHQPIIIYSTDVTNECHWDLVVWFTLRIFLMFDIFAQITRPPNEICPKWNTIFRSYTNRKLSFTISQTIRIVKLEFWSQSVCVYWTWRSTGEGEEKQRLLQQKHKIFNDYGVKIKLLGSFLATSCISMTFFVSFSGDISSFPPILRNRNSF